MKIKLGKYNLLNDIECKIIVGGYEIFSKTVGERGITPSDFPNAYWGDYGSIIVEDVVGNSE